MKFFLKYLVPILLIVIVACPVFSLVAHAQAAPAGATAASAANVPSTNTNTNNFTFYGMKLFDWFNSLIAAIVNAGLSVTAFLVTMSAGLLNVSIIFTLHIRDFVTATPAIYVIWQTIRDVTGLFFIFFLLYAALQMILDMGNNYGKMVVNIVVAGILINFSFFAVSVLIDASNITSQALYNAMVPGPAISITSGSTIQSIASQSTGFNQSSSATSPGKGISNVFLNSLKIQSLYDTTGNKLGAAISDPFKIILIGVVGIIIMITASLSFLLAALAFIARLIILIFLLAFSPLWFAGMIIPQLKEYMGQFRNYLTSQLIFMPVYLLLMYAALSVLNNSNIMGAANASTAGLPTGSNWAFGYMVLAINFAMVIFMLNLPLFVGLKMGGVATDWLKKGMSNFNAANLWSHVGGYVGRHTIGRAAFKADQYLATTRAGNLTIGRDIRAGTVGALAKSNMGSGRSFEKVREEHADVVRKAAANTRLRQLKALLSAGATDPALYKNVIGKMTPREKLELTPEIWQNREFLKQVDDSDYQAYRKSTRVEDTDVVKEAVKQNRREALRHAVSMAGVDPHQKDVIKHMLEEMNGSELMKQEGKPGKAGINVLEDPDVIEHLSPAHLKAMEDENLNVTTKRAIGDAIRAWPATHAGENHPAFGFITKPANRASWS